MDSGKQIESWMRRAIQLAVQASSHGDIPVGAVVVSEGVIIGEGKNERELFQSPESHAEVVAIRQAAKVLGSWNLSDCQLIVTLEPCLMCTGLIVQSRIEKIWFGAEDPKGGALVSTYQVGTQNLTNHKFQFQGGVLKTDCSELLRTFFREMRAQKRSDTETQYFEQISLKTP